MRVERIHAGAFRGATHRPRRLRTVLAALGAAAALTAAPHHATAGAEGNVYENQVFHDCHEVLVTVPVAREQVRGLVPDHYPLAQGGQPPLATVRVANCEYTIDGTARPTLEAEVRIDLDTVSMNATMNDGEENDSHVAGYPCCDWYELSEASNERHFATWYRAGTGMNGVVTLARDLDWQYLPDPTTGVGTFHFEAPSPSEWAFEITATLARPTGPEVPGAVNIWRETDEGQVQITAHDDHEGSGLRLGWVEGTITPQGANLTSLLGGTRTFTSADFTGVTAEIENGVLTKRVNT